MTLTVDEVESLKQRIDLHLSRGALGQWEMQFLTDMRSKLDRSGTSTRLSDKQSRKLYALLSQSSGPFGPPRNRSLRRSRPASSRPARWFGRRQRRDIAVFCILAAVLAILSLARTHLPASLTGPVSTIVRATHLPSFAINGEIRVIDGDTVEVNGEHFRLVGLNTPETFEPRCAEEKALGERARERLKDLLATGAATLTKVPCSCPQGTEGSKKCNYGRSCGVLEIAGRDVARTLIDEGLAAEFHCDATSCPPVPRPWCR